MSEWANAWAALAKLDGDAWDAEHDRLNNLWRDEYRPAFVAYALSRKGWIKEHAEDWADGLLCDAHQYGSGDPAHAAREDVAASEREWESAI